MKLPSQYKKSRRNKLLNLALSVGGLLAIGVALTYTLSTSSTGNYAKDIAKPLEQTLLSNGAVKKCETGDNGRGMDNREPWYKGYFELPKNKDQTVSTVMSAAEGSGYSLTHASPSNRGHLGVADIYIDAWYFDNTSKKHSFTDLQDNKIELALAVNANGADKACGFEIKVDDNHSLVTIHVRLSSFK